MFFTRKPAEKSGLEETIDIMLIELAKKTPGTEEYDYILKQLTELYNLKKIDGDIETPRKWRPEFVVPAVATLVGILIIVGYERVNVVTSKALNFVPKPQ